jgi:putative transcriptional regulator
VTEKLAPALLVAMPQLMDSNFRRSVVLVTEHDETGTFGLVINRGTDLDMQTLCANLEMRWTGSPEEPVNWGGPVSPDHGWVLVGEEPALDVSLVQVADGILFTSSPGDLQALADQPPERMRVFLGFSGWGPGQLADEIAAGAWLVAPADAEVVFDTPDDRVWERVLVDMGVNPAMLVSTQGIN